MGYLGIDPGMAGGIAYIMDDGSIVAINMPQTEKDIYEELAYARRQIDFGAIEQVHSMPKQGVASTFKFGYNYGVLIGVLSGLRIPFVRVTPMKWQLAMGCLSRGDKNVTKRKAQELFPSCQKITHKTADALLIAEWCRRNFKDKEDMWRDL